VTNRYLAQTKKKIRRLKSIIWIAFLRLRKTSSVIEAEEKAPGNFFKVYQDLPSHGKASSYPIRFLHSSCILVSLPRYSLPFFFPLTDVELIKKCLMAMVEA